MVKVVLNLPEFEQEINKPTLVVVDYFATWCGPCVAIAPFFASLAEKYPNVTFLKVDVDDAEDIAAKQMIEAMPTFQFFKGGVKVEEMVGADKTALEGLIVRHQ